MYVKIVEQLLTPILETAINKIEIREIDHSNQEIEIIILAPKELFKRIVGKNGTIIQAVSTIVQARAKHNDQNAKVTLNEL